VNLDEEAIALLEFQRAYEAAAKMVATLDEMTETVLNMI
jgi:flagellar hook-associated protein FlgK